MTSPATCRRKQLVLIDAILERKRVHLLVSISDLTSIWLGIAKLAVRCVAVQVRKYEPIYISRQAGGLCSLQGLLSYHNA